MTLADMPTVAINIETPSGAGSAGYMVIGSGLIGTGTIAGPSGYSTNYDAQQRGFTITRGSKDVTEALWHADTGTATVTLDNRVREFDPITNSDIRPMRHAGIQATWNAVTYDLINGFVSEWPLSYPAYAHDAVAQIEIVDGSDFLSDLNVTSTSPRQLTGARINALADIAAWPVSLRNVSAGRTTMPTSVQTTSAWRALVEAADSEMGELYVETDGTLTFRSRDDIVTQSRSTTSQATFGDGGGSELSIHDLTISYDRTRIRNDIAVTYNESNAVAYASDATSIQKYGKRSYTLQVAISSGSTAQALANYLLLLYKEPVVRVDQIVLKPRRDPTNLWPQALGRKLSDRITVKFTPTGGGTRVNVDCFIRSIQHDVTADGDWTTTFGLQDATVFSGYMVIGTSTIGSADKIWF